MVAILFNCTKAITPFNFAMPIDLVHPDGTNRQSEGKINAVNAMQLSQMWKLSIQNYFQFCEELDPYLGQGDINPIQL